MPIGIFATLAICALLYGSVALVLTGIAHWDTLNNDAPVANALKAIGMNRLRLIVTAGALVGMVSSLLVFQYGQARVWFAMSRDRLLPDVFSRVHPKYKTPYVSTWVAGFLVGIPAGVFDISWFSDLSNIGTLFAFILVSAGVIVLRKKQPERKRGFRVPWVPLLPGISIVCCLVLMLSLPLETWIRFFVWLVIGLFIYFLYGQKRTRDFA
jgi:APA family basic amino acid/polyamine antiporter